MDRGVGRVPADHARRLRFKLRGRIDERRPFAELPDERFAAVPRGGALGRREREVRGGAERVTRRVVARSPGQEAMT